MITSLTQASYSGLTREEFRNVGNPWDEAQDATLKDLMKAGYSYTAIASNMKRTLPGIMARCDRLGLLHAGDEVPVNIREVDLTQFLATLGGKQAAANLSKAAKVTRKARKPRARK